MATREIIIDDRDWVDIKNSHGDITGGFWFNASDIGIVKRCEKVVEYFNNIEVPDDLTIEAIQDLEEKIKEQFDYLLDTDASSELFKHYTPLSPTESGSLFAEYVLEIIAKFVEKEMGVRIKKTKAKVNKYTAKYGR